jgi:hypothetical protein
VQFLQVEGKTSNMILNNCHVMHISSLVMTRPIFSFHVIVINNTLGWDDELSPLPKQESATCGYDAKY